MSEEQEAKKEAKRIANVAKKTNFGKPVLLGSKKTSEVSPERMREAEKGGIAADWALMRKAEMLQVAGSVRDVKDMSKALEIVNAAEKEFNASRAKTTALKMTKGGIEI